MFLKPTAKPEPRRTASASAVRPAPPGRAMASTLELGRDQVGDVDDGLDDLGHRRGTGDHLTGGQHVAGLQRVLEAELDRVDAQGVGELVHLGLVGEAGLHRAEAAHGPAGRVVGAHRPAVDVGVGRDVRAHGEAGGVADDGRRRRGVGATVEDQAGLDVDEGAVGRGVVAVPHARRVPMDVAEERFGPVVDHLHGPAGAQGEQGEVDLEADVLACTEGAADAGQLQAHLLGRQSGATPPPGPGRRGATGWRCRARCHRPRSVRPCPPRCRGGPDPACRPRRCPRRPRRRGRRCPRGGSRGGARRSRRGGWPVPRWRPRRRSTAG